MRNRPQEPTPGLPHQFTHQEAIDAAAQDSELLQQYQPKPEKGELPPTDEPPAPPSLNPDWLTWNKGAVPGLAKSFLQDRDFENIPMLADALEDAGCTDSRILDTLRSNPQSPEASLWVLSIARGEQGPNVEILNNWLRFYQTYFPAKEFPNLNVDFSTVQFPERTPEELQEFTFDMVIPEGITAKDAYQALEQAGSRIDPATIGKAQHPQGRSYFTCYSSVNLSNVKDVDF